MPILPGSILRLPDGMRCDKHPERPAFTCRVGECDSFGYEEMYKCWHCEMSFRRSQKRNANGVQGWCDWCKSESHTIKPFRDLEEGNHGPVYDVCEPCRTNYHERMRKEFDDEPEEPHYPIYDDYDDEPPEYVLVLDRQ